MRYVVGAIRGKFDAVAEMQQGWERFDESIRTSSRMRNIRGGTIVTKFYIVREREVCSRHMDIV